MPDEIAKSNQGIHLQASPFCENFRSGLRETSQHNFGSLKEGLQIARLLVGTRLAGIESEPEEHAGILCHQPTFCYCGSSMREATRHTEADETKVENGQALSLPGISLLHSIPGFDRMSRHKLYRKGAVVLVEGQSAAGVYVLCGGSAKLSVTSADGKTLIVRIARKGDLLGIHAVLAGQPYEATAETLTPSRIDFISRKDLLLLLDRQKSSGLSLALSISKEFTEFVENTRALLSSVSTAEKLARVLLRLGDDFGERTPTGIRLQTRLTHEEIAQMIGASRETVTRAFGELKRKHLIGWADNAIFVRNQKGLESVAGY